MFKVTHHLLQYFPKSSSFLHSLLFLLHRLPQLLQGLHVDLQHCHQTRAKYVRTHTGGGLGEWWQRWPMASAVSAKYIRSSASAQPASSKIVQYLEKQPSVIGSVKCACVGGPHPPGWLRACAWSPWSIGLPSWLIGVNTLHASLCAIITIILLINSPSILSSFQCSHLYFTFAPFIVLPKVHPFPIIALKQCLKTCDRKTLFFSSVFSGYLRWAQIRSKYASTIFLLCPSGTELCILSLTTHVPSKYKATTTKKYG